MKETRSELVSKVNFRFPLISFPEVGSASAVTLESLNFTNGYSFWIYQNIVYETKVSVI